MSAPTRDIDAATERRVEQMRERRGRKQGRRETLAMVAFSGGFVAAALALALVADPAGELSPGLALAFVAALALAAGIEFSVGAATAVPTQLVFVPMLLLLPTPLVPLFVAAAMVASALFDAVRGGTAPGRSVLAVSDAWFALGPAVVLVAAGRAAPGTGRSGRRTSPRWLRS